MPPGYRNESNLPDLFLFAKNVCSIILLKIKKQEENGSQILHPAPLFLSDFPDDLLLDAGILN